MPSAYPPNPGTGSIAPTAAGGRDKWPQPPNVTHRFLADSWGNRAANIFHGLNQRLPKRRFRRQVATFHDLFVLSGEYSTPDFRARFALQAKEAAAGADLIITVSAFTASQVEHYLKVPGARIRVIPHGVIPRSIPNLPREKVVLCVGAIQKRKNQAMLIRAFRAMPGDWTLVLAGSRGFEAEAVLLRCKRSHSNHRISNRRRDRPVVCPREHIRVSLPR